MALKVKTNIILKCQGLKNVTINLSQPHIFLFSLCFLFLLKGEKGYCVVIPAHRLYDSYEQFQATRVQKWKF